MAHAAPAPGDRALHRPARHALRRASRATGQLGGPRRPAPLGKTPRRARRRNARRGKPAMPACSSAPGRPYFCAAPPGAHLRLSFAAVEQVGEIREAVQRLARVLAAQPPRSPRGRPAASARYTRSVHPRGGRTHRPSQLKKRVSSPTCPPPGPRHAVVRCGSPAASCSTLPPPHPERG